MRLWKLLLPLLLILDGPAWASLQPSQFADLAFRQHPGAQLPLDATLRDEAGRPVRLGALLGGRPAILVLEYVRCRNLCSLVLDNAVREMADSKLRPGRDLDFIAVSIDPREQPADSAAARVMYLGRYGAGVTADGWHFLTGPAPQVRRIADAVGFLYRYDPITDQFAHPAGFVVVTPSGRIARYILGLSHEPAPLRAAVAAAAEGEVQPPAHPLLLLCFGYDPQPGSASDIAIRSLRAVALLALLGLGLWIAAMMRRERRPG